MKVFSSVHEIETAIGAHVGYGDWLEITQERIDQFADATGDHQWIHVDPERAIQGPFGTTIAHGYLTLSIIPRLTDGILRVEGIAMAVNYGCNKVRFPAHVPVGSRIRAGVEVVSVEHSSNKTTLVTRVTVELDGSDKPVCVAECVTLLVS